MAARGDAAVVPLQQRKLRNACLRGDVEAVKRLLLPRQLPRWKRALKVICGSGLLHALGIDTCTEAAHLDYVYFDDDANMAIHYIAKGQTALLPRLVRSFLAPVEQWEGPSPAGQSGCGEGRAALLKHIFTEVAQGRQANGGMCLSAVNGSLETPLHCAIRSFSTQVVEQLLHLGLSTTQGTSAQHLRNCMVLRHGLATTSKLTLRHVEEFMLVVDSMDEHGWVPLDLAVSLAQWTTVRMLLAAGAHEGRCPGLRSAEDRLAYWTCKLDNPSGVVMPSEQATTSTVVAGVAKLSKSLLGNMAGRLFQIASQAVGYDTAKNPLLIEAQDEDRGEWAGEGDTAGDVGVSSGKAVVYDNTAEVAQRQQAAAEHVAYVVGVNLQAATALLNAHGGRAEAAIEAYLNDRKDACAAAGLSETSVGVEASVAATTAATSVSTAVCIVCFDDVSPNEGQSVTMACGHLCCDQCWLGLLRARLDDGDVHRAVCPAEGCQLPLPLSAARFILPPDMYDRYSRLVGQKAVETTTDLKWCPNPGCERSLELGEDLRLAFQHSVAVECACGHRFCWSCSQAPHEPASCSQMVEWQRLMRAVVEEAEEHTQNWMSAATKACPRCSARIQKTGGCNHMVCQNCSHHFCWTCMGDWRLHNAQTGGYYSCSLETTERDLQARDTSGFEGQDGAASSAHRAREAGSTGLLQGLYRAVQMPFRNMRLAHYMRCYSQHTQYTWQNLSEAASKISDLWQLAALRCEAELSDPRCLSLGGGRPLSSGEAASTQNSKSWNEFGAGQGYALMVLLGGAEAATPVDGSPFAGADARGRLLLEELAREVAAAHALLGHSYVLGWFMAWGRCRRYFEHLQGELETAVEAATVPLATFPRDTDLPLPTQQRQQSGRPGQQTSLQFRQFYHALVLHRQLGPVLAVLRRVRKQSHGLARKARRGVFATACRGGDEVPPTASLDSSDPTTR